MAPLDAGEPQRTPRRDTLRAHGMGGRALALAAADSLMQPRRDRQSTTTRAGREQDGRQATRPAPDVHMTRPLTYKSETDHCPTDRRLQADTADVDCRPL